jgi:hypothetical protein
MGNWEWGKNVDLEPLERVNIALAGLRIVVLCYDDEHDDGHLHRTMFSGTNHGTTSCYRAPRCRRKCATNAIARAC